MRLQLSLAVGFLATGLVLAQAPQSAPSQPAGTPQGQETSPSQSPASTAQAPAKPPATNAQCMDCHGKSNPQVIAEWKQSKHSQVNVGCVDCHGADHSSTDDVNNVKIARANVCARCHQTQVDQDRRGKHSRALGAMKTMPNGHWRSAAPARPTGGGEVCTDCHRTGSPHIFQDLPYAHFGGIEGLSLEWGAGACSSCHSRHAFSVQEARQPQACEYCHSGPDADQWGMYSTSQHGILFDLKQRGLLPSDTAVPTCQTCHMPKGDHEVHTAWGYRGIRLPLPQDKQWAADVTEQFKALNILQADGSDGTLKATIKGTDLMRFTEEDWQKDRAKMVDICAQCHSATFAQQELRNGDDMIRDTDHLLAQALQVVSDLYKDGLLAPPAETRLYPWLTRFDSPPSVIEHKLNDMYQLGRGRAFQGTFHSNPNYAVARGRAEMQADLDEIKDLAAQLRRDHPGTGAHPKPQAVPANPKAPPPQKPDAGFGDPQ
jgi:hydroxylamine dehydrogenase